MTDTLTAIDRPQRWDVPFGPEMTEADVQRLLKIEPFKSIDPNKFPESTPLAGILANDTRLVKYRSGDLVVREGDYGHSAFLILKGKVRVVLESLPPALLGRQTRKRKGWWEALSQWWSNPRLPEVRSIKKYEQAKAEGVAQRGSGESTRVFLQDVPGVIGKHKTVQLGEGSLFGELAALGRIPRTATIVAESDAELLEIRWQGLRDIRRRDDALKRHIDALYRKNALQSFLRDTPIFAHLDEKQLKEVADETEFETHGGFEWYATYKTLAQQGAAERLAQEPVIASEGDYPNGLILIRSGFARVSRREGNGHRTLSYTGAGGMYGFEELAHNWRSKDVVPLQNTLRAVGYVDILRVPSPIVEKYVLEMLKPEQLPAMIQEKVAELADVGKGKEANGDARAAAAERSMALPVARVNTRKQIDTGLLEFLVELVGIVELAGKAIENIYDYTYALEALKVNVPVHFINQDQAPGIKKGGAAHTTGLEITDASGDGVADPGHPRAERLSGRSPVPRAVGFSRPAPATGVRPRGTILDSGASTCCDTSRPRSSAPPSRCPRSCSRAARPRGSPWASSSATRSASNWLTASRTREPPRPRQSRSSATRSR